jgi:hypothetical protein
MGRGGTLTSPPGISKLWLDENCGPAPGKDQRGALSLAASGLPAYLDSVRWELAIPVQMVRADLV